MKPTITKNKEQQLYVFNTGNSYTCLGFDVCEGRKERLAKELGETIKPHRKGSLASYKEYQRLLNIAAKKHKQTGWRSKSELIPEFIGHEGKRVEIVDKWEEKRRFYIGKSTGFIPCHLEIQRINSNGGVSVCGYPFKSYRFI